MTLTICIARLLFLLSLVLPAPGALAAEAVSVRQVGGQDQAAALRRGFASPPHEARTRCFWWWLNGNVTKTAITRDLEEMKAKGFGGAIIFDSDCSGWAGNNPVPAGPMFGTPPWRELFQHAVHEADRLGLELSLSIQSGWNLGGPDVTSKQAAKQLTWSETRVRGPVSFDAQLQTPKHRADFYRDIAVTAYRVTQSPRGANGEVAEGTIRRKPIRQLDRKAAFHEIGGSAPDCRPLLEDYPATPDEEDVLLDGIVNLTDRLKSDGRLAWDIPEGDWVILRFGYTITGAKVAGASGAWQGLVIDYMSTGALKTYWDCHVQPLLDGIGSLAGTTLKYLHTDSWECGGMNWTDGFQQEFSKRRGYDPVPFLPVIAGRIVESRDASNRFLADFRKTIGDCVAENHYEVFRQLAHRSGLGIHPESGGPHAGPFDALTCLGRNDVPMSEFWVPSPHRPRPENRFFVKQAASAAHIYDKRLVAAEGFTSIGPHWDDVLWQSAKPSFDHEACNGLNLTFVHTFTCSPKKMGLPGQEYFAGTHFNPNVTWWEKAGAVIDYLNRCQYILQQGRFVADACYYYGDHVPNLAQRKEADPAGVLPGYDYDVLNEEVLLAQLQVVDRRLVLPHGMSYRLLVLPNHKILSLAALKKIHNLVRDGATVIGPEPKGTVSLTGYPESEKEFHQLADALWETPQHAAGERRYGSGRMIWGKTAREVLLEDEVLPDFEFSGGKPDTALDYIHRTIDDIDVYFVSNQSQRAESVRCGFRVRAKQPELWDPLTGQVRDAVAFQQSGGRTTLPLEFDPYGSIFVVFRGPISADAAGTGDRNFPVYSEPREIHGPWTVHFDTRWGGPKSVVFDQLVSWTNRPEEGIRYYSGTATYQTTFRLPRALCKPRQRVALDLGEVGHIAEVRLNGKDLGVLWTKPFRIEITDAIHPGDNLLEIEVVNNWTNRLVGDATLPPRQRLTRTNITKITKDTALADSGLIGPVRLMRMAWQSASADGSD